MGITKSQKILMILALGYCYDCTLNEIKSRNTNKIKSDKNLIEGELL